MENSQSSFFFFQGVLVASSVFVWRFDRSEYKGNEIIKKTSNSSRLYRLIFGVYCLNGGEINKYNTGNTHKVTMALIPLCHRFSVWGYYQVSRPF